MRATRGTLLLILLLVQMGLAPIGAEIASDEPSFSVGHRTSKIPTLLSANLDGVTFISAGYDLPPMKRCGAGGPAIVTTVLSPVLRGDLRVWSQHATAPVRAVFRGARGARAPPSREA